MDSGLGTPRAATGAVAAVVPPSADPPAPAGAPWGSGPPTYTFDRGPGGLLAKESLPVMPPWLVWETSYVYDADLDLTQETRNDGKKFTFTRHPSSGQLLQFTVPDDAQDGATLWSLFYEPTGARRLERIVHNSHTLLYTYAGALPASEMWESGNMGGALGASVVRGWDNRLRPIATQVVQPAAATIVATTTEKVAYDHDNLPIAISLHAANDAKLVDLQLQRDPATGQLTKLVVNAEPGVANTLKVLEVDYTYNGFGEPASVTVVDPMPLQELEYSETYLERDAIGRVTKRVVDGAGIAQVEHSYTYHAQRGWLETHSKNGVLSDKWSYDLRGNRTGQKVGLTGQTTASHDAHDRLLQSGAETFSYDLQGRVVSRTGGAHNAIYTWDAFGHLRRATLTPSQQSATDVEYRLDPAGRRIRSRALDANDIALEDHSWVYDGDLRVIAELAANGKLKARYLYATIGYSPDVAVTFHPDSGAVTGVYLLVHDQVGSVVRTLDVADGSAVESVEYDAWGVATVSPGGNCLHPFGFAGGLWDRRTGLVRFGAREYDAGIGRWLARDPIGFGGGWNQYGYVGNLPGSIVDPLGLCGQCTDFDEFGPRADGSELFSRVLGNATGRANSMADFLGHLMNFRDHTLGTVEVYSHGYVDWLQMFGGVVLPDYVESLKPAKKKFGPHGRLVLSVCNSGSFPLMAAMAKNLGVDVFGPSGGLFFGYLGSFKKGATWVKCDKNGNCISESP